VRRNICITRKEGIKLKRQQIYVELRKPLAKGSKKEKKVRKNELELCTAW